MYGSRPLIVSDCLPQKELVESYDCGLAYSSQAEFVQAIEQLAGDRDMRERLGSNGYKMLYENYNNEDYENILLGLYQQLEQESEV
jgi:glycosyltransferase involved in cell wall biosynthesis